MKIHIIPILQDNYAYVVEEGDVTVVIDPGEAEPIIAFLEQNNLKPDWVINTHKHWDHVNGNAVILEKYNARLAAPAECGDSDHLLKDGDQFLGFDVIETPGHTMGHIVLYHPVEKILFSGDTLFSMGCGRLFEGAADDIFPSIQHIKLLPPETQIYCGHEYTLSNAKFAANILPHNHDIQNRLSVISGQKCTIPTLLSEELKTNPFLLAETVEEFTRYRTAKDNFYESAT